MLNAVLKGKTQGILRQDYTGEFVGYEDSLTATVFERLFYLSQPRLEAILDRLLQDAGLGRRAADLDIIQDYAFWPTWPVTGGRYKVPDVYVQFERADLIVEAKRWDVPQHYFEQWAGEIQAWSCNHPGCPRPPLLLAIGGLSDDVRHISALKGQAVASAEFIDRKVRDADFDLLATSWRQFALIIRAQLKKNSLAMSDRFILRDMLSGLALHKINTAEQRFFGQLSGELTHLRLAISNSAQGAFRPNVTKGYFDAAWLQRTAAFRPINLPHDKGAKNV